MFKTLKMPLLLAFVGLAGGSALADPGAPAQPPEPVFLFEVQAAVVEDTQPYAFQVWGDRDGGSYTAYGIQVVAPNGATQLLDEFESILPMDSEADALVVEDVNFDGYADVRIMEYLPGGSAVPFFYWLYRPEDGTFARAESYQNVKSPLVDPALRQLVSRQKVSSTEVITEFYDPQGDGVRLVRKEVRNLNPDGSARLHVFTFKDGVTPELVETRTLAPGEL